jgi:SAM-dependent methyltransferase
LVTRPETDRAFLQGDAYADSTKLNSRASLYDHRIPAGSLHDWVLGLTDWPEGARVLDVGCGPGSYLAALGATARGLRTTGVDLSPGMATEAAAHAPVLVADAAQLPFPDDGFERVLAPHMLYHCPDTSAAVVELRRVLRPRGVLIAVTNDPSHLAELDAIHAAAIGRTPASVSDRFSLDNGGPVVEAVFDDVRLARFDGELVVRDAGPLIRYLASMMTWTVDDAKDEALADIERTLTTIIQRDGAFRARTRAGAFICR